MKKIVLALLFSIISLFAYEELNIDNFDSKIKDKMSIVLTICLTLAFSLLIIGHFIESAFICKVIIMSLGFFLILAIRDSFQTYIEDVALTISNKEEQQEIIIKIEVYRRLGTLILSAIFTLLS